MSNQIPPELDKEAQTCFKACWWRIELDQSIYSLTPEQYAACWTAAVKAWKDSKK